MADIALLVVEEFERRQRLESMKQGQEVMKVSTSGLNIIHGLKELELGLTFEKVRGPLEAVAERILEPKTTVGLAAINGLFSA